MQEARHVLKGIGSIPCTGQGEFGREFVLSLEEQCCPQARALELDNYLDRMLFSVRKSA